MQLALPNAGQAPRGGLRLPPCVPPFNTLTYRLFTAVWMIAFALALVGPLAGLYERYHERGNNSQLLLGSRAGFAVSPRDATFVRFTVGPQSASAGVMPGDHIIAIYGLALPPSMPVNEQALAEHANDPAYIALGNLLFGTDSAEVPLTVRDPDGRVRDITVTTGDNHIDDGARALGISPKWLNFIDLLHVLAYPFLLWAAWMLHHRNARDAVSSILSLAVLLTIAAEQPASMVLASAGVPRWLNVAMFDLGNVLLLTGILLFPHGNLSWRRVALMAALPTLMFLQGTLYQTFFICFMIIAVLSLLRTLRLTESGDQRQQIHWALLGITGYAVLRCISIVGDYLKWSTHSFGQQLLVEILAGISFALAVLVLQVGLLVALVRYRLYDAEFVISRSANVALITLAVAAIFAGTADGLKQIIYNYYGNTSSEGPIIFAAALSTVLVNPIQERVQRWSQKRFQKNLFLLRDDLPEVARDMRETASLGEMLEEILARVDRGVRAVRSSAIVNGCVLRARGLSIDDVEAWRISRFAQDYKSDICEPTDKLFPIRVPLVPSSDDEEPIGYLLVGPRPDGSIPSRDEQKALKEVQESIARAIRTVIKREARELQVSDLIADNARRIEELEALLSGRPLASGRPRPRTA
ncbi:MAG: hypothetical protein QOE50_793 [Sphingomonadales bacterium]|nr:hypothetical protein [Sphingomonadales bacterium]